MANDVITTSVRSVLQQEAQAISHVATAVDESYTRCVELILACSGKVVVTGIGKSGIVGRKIAATLSSTGTVAIFLHPAEALHGDLGMVQSGDVVLALSKSGESDELNAILPSLRRIGVSLVALTSRMDSTLARQADIVLHTPIRQEACPYDLAPTISSTVALAVGDAIAMTLMQLKEFQPEHFAVFHPGGKLGRRLLLTVEDLMIPLDRCPVIATEAASIEALILALSEYGLGAVLLVDQHERLEGIVTDGDIRRALQQYRHEVFDLSIDHVIKRSPVVLEPAWKAVDALAFMEDRSKPLNVAPVVDSTHGRLLGLVRLHELVKLA